MKAFDLIISNETSIVRFKSLLKKLKITKLILVTITIFAVIAIHDLPMTFASDKQEINTSKYSLLSDPFLQLPTKNTVNVVWFTEFLGSHHVVKYGAELNNKAMQRGLGADADKSFLPAARSADRRETTGTHSRPQRHRGSASEPSTKAKARSAVQQRLEPHVAIASTTKLTRMREDEDSHLDFPPAKSQRNIWRHEATVTGLEPNQRLPYKVESVVEGQVVSSDVFTLAGNPTPETALKILLTSDHQLMPMTPANLSQVEQTIGWVDGVFLPGDLVNIPDRASEWFDDSRGGAFFPSLQGRANYELEQEDITTTYHGGQIIQHAPLFTAIGNHEVMGKVSAQSSLKEEFGQPQPRKVAQEFYQANIAQVNPTNDPQVKTGWIKDNSFNTDTYEEMFSLPQSKAGGKHYYATTFGDIRLISLYVTNIWRSPSLAASALGRYKESDEDINNPQGWGYGQHIFEPIAKGSAQYQWLAQELQSEAYQQAKYKIVMFHHPPHTLGGNIVPPYTDPQPRLYYTDNNQVQSRYYDYPIENDYIIRDLLPLLESAGVQLVYYGHSHLWNRFQSESGIHFLESSNVGNSYGAHDANNPRPVPTYSPKNFVTTGDPNGLNPIVPNIAPLTDDSGQPLAYIASDEITVFSIFDTATGTVSSYRFDTRLPNSKAVMFDQFELITN